MPQLKTNPDSDLRGCVAEDIMSAVVVTVHPDQTVGEAARLMARHHVTGAPVVAETKLVGMITERDIVRAVIPPLPTVGELSALTLLVHLDDARERRDIPVGHAMMTLVASVSPDTPAATVAAEMEARGVNRLPVVDDAGDLVGIVSRGDIVRAIAQPEY